MTGGIGKDSGADGEARLPDEPPTEPAHPSGDGSADGGPAPSADGNPAVENGAETPVTDDAAAETVAIDTTATPVEPDVPGSAVAEDSTAETVVIDTTSAEEPAATEFVRPEDVPTTVLPKVTLPAAAAPEAPPTSAEPTAAEPAPAEPAPSVPTAVEPAPSEPTPGEPTPTAGFRGGRRAAIAAAAGVLTVGAIWYAADLALSSDRVPRGVRVAGVEVGGKSHAEAETVLRAAIDPRAQQSVSVRAGDVTTELVPAAAGLAVDWPATLDRAGDQPLNPITRLTSLFTHREVGVSSTRDDAALAAAVEGLRPRTDRAPVEGAVVFDGAIPVAVSPVPGQAIDSAGAADALADGWAAAGGVEVPVTSAPVSVTQSGVERALRDVATPAASADLVVRGRDAGTAVLARDRIGSVLTFTPDGNGGLAPQFNVDAAVGVLGSQLADTEVKPKDASFSLSGGAPTVVPGVTGEMIEWHRTLEALPARFTEAGPHTLDAVYEPKQPELTTEAANKLGVTEVIGEYTTGGFEYASGVNIRLAAGEIDGALVKPRETFSLNDYTGPRGSAQGYVESGIINNGRPDKAVGGGISQLATTLYNAAYFAGMEDAGHTEHSYYISRYPEAREATVFEGAIDLKFTNNTDTGVLIETIGTSSDITVRLWGTKTVDVESITGDRYAHTSPNTVTLPAGSGCIASSGAQGFTTSDTRVISDHASGRELSRNTRTVKYDPVPIVRCVSPEPVPAAVPAAAPAPAAAAAPAAPAAAPVADDEDDEDEE